jgi:hypothetical protein
VVPILLSGDQEGPILQGFPAVEDIALLIVKTDVIGSRSAFLAMSSIQHFMRLFGAGFVGGNLHKLFWVCSGKSLFSLLQWNRCSPVSETK